MTNVAGIVPRAADSPPETTAIMLVKITNHKGEDVWINPIHVRTIRAKGSYTEVVIDPVYLTIKTQTPAEEIAGAVAAATAGAAVARFAPDGASPSAD